MKRIGERIQFFSDAREIKRPKYVLYRLPSSQRSMRRRKTLRLQKLTRVNRRLIETADGGKD